MKKREKLIFGVIAAALLFGAVQLYRELMVANMHESCNYESLLKCKEVWPYYIGATAFFFCVALLQSRFVKTPLLISWLLLSGAGLHLLFTMCGHESFSYIPFMALGLAVLWGVLCLILMFRKWE